MPALHNLKDEDLQSLAPDAGEALAQQVCLRPPLQNSGIRFEDVKVKTFTFELARLKTWKFGAEIEAMSADQRRLFDETLVEDGASLPAQLEQARRKASTSPAVDGDGDNNRKPRRSIVQSPASCQVPSRTRKHELNEFGVRPTHEPNQRGR